MTQKYFRNLNYTLGNEDSTLERNMCLDLLPKKILSIAGCGGRALPLIQDQTTDLYCIDVSLAQLHLTELREKTILELSHSDFLRFWSYPPYAEYDYSFERKKMFESLNLCPEAKSFFTDYFNSINYASLLYEGKWEKTFIIFSRVIRSFLGKDFVKIFSFTNLDEQIKFYHEKFPIKRWMVVMGILGNKSMFNALLYKGDFIKKNIPESYFDFYKKTYDYLFTSSLARENFFLNLCFFGKLLHESANTIEAQSECFLQMKKSLKSKTKVHLVNKNLSDVCVDLKGAKIDFVSLSDVPSYFSGDLEKNFLQDLKPILSKDAIVVIRYYLKICEADESGFSNVSSTYKNYINQEKVQMYRVKVLKFNE